MKLTSHVKRSLMLVLALTGIVGAVLGAWDLQRAIALCQGLYSVDAVGTGARPMVRGIIGLAHNLELEVVAEGVETEEQFDVLRSLGCFGDIGSTAVSGRFYPSESGPDPSVKLHDKLAEYY